MLYLLAERHRFPRTTALLTNQTGKESGMASRIIIDCKRCGQPFPIIPSRLGKAAYCSKACLFPKQEPRLCLICSEPLPYRMLSEKRHKFCSVKCRGINVSREQAFRPPLEERFWAKVDKTPGQGPNGDCWIWRGTTCSEGYGRLTERGKVIRAHIYSYKIHKGDIEKGLFVCHFCDVRNCVNIDHLWLGTNAANMADMVAKGRARSPRGEKSPVAKLSDAQALAILQDPREQGDIARDYNVSQSTVSLIKVRKTWKHLQP